MPVNQYIGTDALLEALPPGSTLDRIRFLDGTPTHWRVYQHQRGLLSTGKTAREALENYYFLVRPNELAAS